MAKSNIIYLISILLFCCLVVSEKPDCFFEEVEGCSLVDKIQHEDYPCMKCTCIPPGVTTFRIYRICCTDYGKKGCKP